MISDDSRSPRLYTENFFKKFFYAFTFVSGESRLPHRGNVGEVSREIHAASHNIAGFNVFYEIEQHPLHLSSVNEGLNCQLHLSRHLPRVNDRRNSTLLTRTRALN